MTTPVFGVIPSGAGPEPAGYATIIPNASPSIEPIDMFITGWSSPSHTLESQAGTERIETGSVITDHVVAMPSKLTMTGWVSNLAQDGNAPAEAWNAIRDLHLKEDVFKVVTEWAVYEEMIIIGASTTQTGRGMRFTIDLQEIVRVGLQQGDTSAIPRNAGGPATGRSAEVDQGLTNIPGVAVGDGLFLTGFPGDPDRRLITIDEDGEITIPPASSDDTEN